MKRLIFLVALVFLISLPMVLGDNITNGVTYDSSKTYTFRGQDINPNARTGWSGTFTVQGNAFTINNKRYAYDGTRVYDTSSGVWVSGAAGRYARSYSGSAGAGVGGVHPAGTPNQPRVEEYAYEKDGKVYIRRVTYAGTAGTTVEELTLNDDGSRPKDAAGADIFMPVITFGPSSDLSRVQWERWDGTDNTYTTQDGRKIVVTPAAPVDGVAAKPFGQNAGDSYTVTSRDGKTVTTYNVKIEDGRAVQFKALEIKEIEGGKVTINYETNVVTIPVELAGSEITMDRAYYETVASRINWQLTNQNDDGYVYIDANTRISRVEQPGDGSVSYITQTRYAGQLVAAEDFNIRDDGAGNKVTTKTVFDPATGNIESSHVEESFNNGQLTIVRNYDGGIAPENIDGDVVITRNPGQPNQERVEIDNDDFANYMANRQLDSTTAEDVLFAYQRLGSDGRYFDGGYTTRSGPTDNDYEEVTVGEGLRTYSEYEDGKVVSGEIEVVTDGAVVENAPFDYSASAGDRITIDENRRLFYEDGHLTFAQDKDDAGNIYETQFTFNANTGQYERTTIFLSADQNVGVVLSYNSDFNVYTSPSHLTLGTRLNNWNSDGDPVVWDPNTNGYVEVNRGDWIVYDDARQEYVKASPGAEGADVVLQSDLDAAEMVGQAVEKDQDAVEDHEEAERAADAKNREEAPPAASYPTSFWSAVGSYEPYNEVSNLLMRSMMGDTWDEYINKVDRIFAENYIGIDYWVSWVCRGTIGGWFGPRLGQEEGTAYVETPSGIVQFLGHVEGDKSTEPVYVTCNSDAECVNNTYRADAVCGESVCVDANNNPIMMYFYKFTYSVTAPSDPALTPDRNEYPPYEVVSFNVFVGNKGDGWEGEENDKSAHLINSKPLYSGNRELQNGQNFNDLQMKYSSNDYDAICIKFVRKPWTRPYEAGGVGEVRSICNSFASTERSYENANAAGAGAAPITYDPNW